MHTSLRVAVALVCALGIAGGGCISRVGTEERAALSPAEKRSGVVTGYVTDTVTGGPVAEADVSFEPYPGPGEFRKELHPVGGVSRLTTDDDGFFYAKVPAGRYRLTFTREEYRDAGRVVEVGPGMKSSGDVALEPTPPVVVYAGKTIRNVAPGARVRCGATVTVRDGSQVKAIRWQAVEDLGRVAVRHLEQKGAEVTVTLPGTEAFKGALIERLARQGRLLDRWMVLGIGPVDLKEAGQIDLVVSVETTSGTYTDRVAIFPDLKSVVAVSPGVQNVAVGEPVLLQGKEQGRYGWSMTGPAGSTARLHDAATRNPHFVPDLPGEYRISEGGAVRLAVLAGKWGGAVVARQTETRHPWVGAYGCSCHTSDAVSQRFRSWAGSGHAEIFTYNLNNSYRYEERCFTCHTVGFLKEPPGGIAADPSYATFLKDPSLWDLSGATPLSRPRPGNFDNCLKKYPKVVRLANVQCENCHGPNESPAHKTLQSGSAARVSLAASVCATCHDPFADKSHDEWRDSGHSNYNLALAVATAERRGAEAADCGRCHSAQGLLAWHAGRDRAALLHGGRGGGSTEELAALGLSVERVQPVTCSVCHDPHAAGSSFRYATEKVPMRMQDDTVLYPKEFGGTPGGRAVVCITCHSTPTGARNDRDAPVLFIDRAPHASQGDVLVGRNAFFVEPGKYASHLRIEDSCLSCHAKAVPKDKSSGFPRGGVSHTFATAQELCSRCHEEFEGNDFLQATRGNMEMLKEALEGAIFKAISNRGTIRLADTAGGPAAAVESSDVRSVELVELRGELAVRVGTAAGAYRAAPLSRVLVREVPIFSTVKGRILAKGVWNYFLLKRDASNGAHNPRFVAEVVGATMEEIARVP